MNRSAYWVPAAVAPNGAVQTPAWMLIYYKSGYRGVAPHEVQAFPQGLRMIAGSNMAGTATEFIKYECKSASGGYGLGKSIPNCAAGDTLRMLIDFPQCWDGVNLDSPDHRSHMAQASNGCPASHPVPIPAITFQVNYEVPAGGSGGWRLVSDMYDPALPAGRSLHGDWFSGWDDGFRDEFLDGCVRAARDCHAHLMGPNRKTYY